MFTNITYESLFSDLGASFTDDLVQGKKTANVPAGLQKLFPKFSFFLKESKPGVYVIFFPDTEEIYIGQSTNISQEVSMLKGRHRPQPLVNDAFARNGDTVKSYALFMGSGLKDKQLRLNLENKLISFYSDRCLNIIGNKKRQASALKTPLELPGLVMKPYVGNWLPFGLDLPALEPQGGEGCVYAFTHSVTQNFYIGESEDFKGNQVLKRHKTLIRVASRQHGQPNAAKIVKAYTKIYADIQETSNSTFFYSVLEYTDSIDKKERQNKELFYRQLVQQVKDTKIYNPITKPAGPGIRRLSESSRQAIREANIGLKREIDTQAYPCIIKGKWYKSLAEANKALGYSSKGGITRRCLSPAYPDYIWLKNICDKEIPNTPELEEQLQLFYTKLGV